MLTAFIDESGDLGMKDRYFVIAMIVPRKPKRIINFMRRFCAANNLQEVKAAQLTFPEKQFIFNRLCSANDYVVSYIVADKHHIEHKKILEDKNICYNYLFSFLAKKTIQSSNEDICMLLDNHSTKVKSINSLVDYIKIKSITQWHYNHNLNIRYVDSKHSKIVQATDVVANAIYAKYNYEADHFYNMLTIGESIRFPYKNFGTI